MNNKSFILPLSFILLFNAFIWVSCNGEKSSNSRDKSDSAKVNPAPEPSPISNIKDSPFHVKVYMENSSSMEGYNNVNSNGFTSVISDLMYVYGSKNTQGYFFSNKLTKPYNAKNFSEKISSKDVTYGDSSPFCEIMDSILKKNESISFLITDGIMSGSNKEIEKNPQHNIDMRETIQNEFSDKFRYYKDIAVSVYQFTSYFKGKYYCYNNYHKQLEVSNRPYYVFAIGKKKYVKDFADKVKSNSTELSHFIPKNEVHFGLLNIPMSPDFSMSPLSFRDTTDGFSFIIEKKEIPKLRKDGALFSLTLPTDLPPYMRNQTYLDKHIHIMFNEDTIANAKLNEKYTNVINVKVPEKRFRKSSENRIICQLEYALPCWCDSASIDNDLKIFGNSFMQDKTFNLIYLIKGIKNGIENSNAQNVWNIEYTIAIK